MAGNIDTIAANKTTLDAMKDKHPDFWDFSLKIALVMDEFNKNYGWKNKQDCSKAKEDYH